MGMLRDSDPILDKINESPEEAEMRLALRRVVGSLAVALAVTLAATGIGKFLERGLDIPDDFNGLTKEQVRHGYEANQRPEPADMKETNNSDVKIDTALRAELTDDGRILVYEDDQEINYAGG